MDFEEKPKEQFKLQEAMGRNLQAFQRMDFIQHLKSGTTHQQQHVLSTLDVNEIPSKSKSSFIKLSFRLFKILCYCKTILVLFL